MISLRFVTHVEAQIENVFTLLYEVDLYSNWIPNWKGSVIDNEITNTKKTVKWNFSAPTPLDDRSATWFLHGANLLETDKKWVMMLGHSVEGENDDTM